MKNPFKRRKQVFVLTVLYKGKFMNNMVFKNKETGEKITATLQAMFNQKGHRDISFHGRYRTVYDIKTMQDELRSVTKDEDILPDTDGDTEDAGQYGAPVPTVDLDALLAWERNIAGLPTEISASQLVGLWQLSNSYWYDPERRVWDIPVSLLSENVRIRFREDGTAEEYEGKVTTDRSSFLYDSKRRTLTWNEGEHYVVSLSSSCMELVMCEPGTEEYPYTDIHKFIYTRIEE